MGLFLFCCFSTHQTYTHSLSKTTFSLSTNATRQPPALIPSPTTCILPLYLPTITSCSIYKTSVHSFIDIRASKVELNLKSSVLVCIDIRVFEVELKLDFVN